MSFCPENRVIRRPLNVQDLLGEPIRYDKLSSKEEPSGSLRGSIKPPVDAKGTKPSAPLPNLSLNGGMKPNESKAFDAFADSIKKSTPAGPRHVDSAKDPSLLEGMGRAANDLRTITKAPIDAAASHVPGANSAAKVPGRIYEGAAKLIPNSIKDIRIGGYRLGDAADSVAQTFSPVSLDPNATPADHGEQLALAWSGGKLLGKAANALGKHGGKIVNGAGAGAGAVFGPEAIANATDHAARMFGREVPSMATAGGLKAPAPRVVPNQAHMSGTPNVPPQFQGMAGSSTPPPVPPKKPGFFGRAYDAIPLPKEVKGWLAGNAITSALGVAGSGLAGAAYLGAGRSKVSEQAKREAEKQLAPATDNRKKRVEQAYKNAAQGNLRGFAQPNRVNGR